MKIGIFTDIHSNVIALNSILQLFEEKECDEILCCGDIIGIGPFAEETVQRIKSLKNIKCVLGNHEQYLINGIKNHILMVWMKAKSYIMNGNIIY